MTTTVRPTRREERREQTVREIKQLAMDQIAAGGPDAVSLSGIVREMSMSPAAVYRYFASRDALLADLIVDSYNDLADSLVALEPGTSTPREHLDAVLRQMRDWALTNPNAYRLIFQTNIGSGQDFAIERTIPASSRSMTVLIGALAAATADNDSSTDTGAKGDTADTAIRTWAERSGLSAFSDDLLLLALLTWTRLHGIVSLEIGGHLDATGVGATVLFEAEMSAIQVRVTQLAPAP